MKDWLGSKVRYVIILGLCQLMYNLFGFEETIITLLVFILLSIEEHNAKGEVRGG